MTDIEYRAFLDLFMCSDPWPISGDDGQFAHSTLENLANNEALNRGYDDWVVAFHEFKPKTIWGV